MLRTKVHPMSRTLNKILSKINVSVKVDYLENIFSVYRKIYDCKLQKKRIVSLVLWGKCLLKAEIFTRKKLVVDKTDKIKKM